MPAIQFRRRPDTVEAIRWAGDNETEIQVWAGMVWGDGTDLFHTLEPEDIGACDGPKATAEVFDKSRLTWVLAYTGQWIVRNPLGNLYPVNDWVLMDVYEPMDIT